jgi:hypothetical protein
MMKGIGIFLFFCAPIFLVAQDDDSNDDFKPRRIPFTIGIDGGIASITTPKAFKTNFNSVGDFTLSLDFGITPRFSASLQGRYAGFQVRQQMVNKADEPQINNQGLDVINETATTLNLISQGVSLNYLGWTGKYAFLTCGLAYGNSLGRYTKFRRDFKGDPNDSKFNTQYIEPRLLLTYFFEDYFAMNIRTSYTHAFDYFSPDKIGLGDGIISYEVRDLKGEIGFFTFAIGFTYSLKRID